MNGSDTTGNLEALISTGKFYVRNINVKKASDCQRMMQMVTGNTVTVQPSLCVNFIYQLQIWCNVPLSGTILVNKGWVLLEKGWIVCYPWVNSTWIRWCAAIHKKIQARDFSECCESPVVLETCLESVHAIQTTQVKHCRHHLRSVQVPRCAGNVPELVKTSCNRTKSTRYLS